MSAFWDDVDDVQMTHSDEPTTEKERAEWASDITPASETGRFMQRLIAEVEAGERHLQSLKDDSGDIICDLEDQVKRLEAELHDSAKNVLSLSASLGKKIERVSELEAENKRLEVKGCPQCPHCHPDSRWP